MFFEQFTILCEENKTTPTKFVKEVLHLSSSKVTAWKNGSIPKYEILNAISNYFNVSIGYLFDGENINHKTSKLSCDEQELLDRFNKLNAINKGKIIERAEMLYNIEEEQRIRESKPIEQHINSVYIDIYDMPVSAGTGTILQGYDKDQLHLKAGPIIDLADFCLRISGDSMEPDYHDGDIILVKGCPTVSIGEIGIFILNDKAYIKELGKNRLTSLNPEYDDILLHEYDSVYCMGKVVGTLEDDDILY